MNEHIEELLKDIPDSEVAEDDNIENEYGDDLMETEDSPTNNSV